MLEHGRADHRASSCRRRRGSRARTISRCATARATSSRCVGGGGAGSRRRTHPRRARRAGRRRHEAVARAGGGAGARRPKAGRGGVPARRPTRRCAARRPRQAQRIQDRAREAHARAGARDRAGVSVEGMMPRTDDGRRTNRSIAWTAGGRSPAPRSTPPNSSTTASPTPSSCRARSPKGGSRRSTRAAAARLPGVIPIMTHENAPQLQLPPAGAKASPAASGKLGETGLPFSDDVIHYAGQHIAVVVADTLEHARARRRAGARCATRRRSRSLEIEDAMSTAYLAEDVVRQAVAAQRAATSRPALAAPGVVKIRADVHDAGRDQQPDGAFGDGRRVGGRQADGLATRRRRWWDRGTSWRRRSESRRRTSACSARSSAAASAAKAFVWPHTILAAMAAKLTGRPVQLNLTRQQMFTSIGHRPPTRQTMTLARAAGRQAHRHAP